MGRALPRLTTETSSRIERLSVSICLWRLRPPQAGTLSDSWLVCRLLLHHLLELMLKATANNTNNPIAHTCFVALLSLSLSLSLVCLLLLPLSCLQSRHRAHSGVAFNLIV